MYKIDHKKFPCSTSLTMNFIGGKWKAVILIHLFNKKRYNELRKEIPMITERTLSLQLKELEEDGLISRTVFTNKAPLKVEYELTELGKTLIPLLNEISNWGKFIAEEHLRIKTEPCTTILKS
ncbi:MULTISPECIES: winged helix-turn-helix transcriptional regulator [Flavobacterium]|uniref:Transcriptional regulator n=2 Tax=Flavobacterium TaxID=237 RepID=A0AA94EZB4_9FLAO|nr:MULTISPECIES: helix-turn-helix domain-containing protein [Flavobacterium]OXA73994.1 MarR family transcriptional regulator [Flavobacterium columnare NBRC 100251 = ATCC 23463]AMA48725.1 MarR family transcriptional regulator [Flavobacterium covae]AND65139.1 MarR family transcriptional regulator [Flavobacterium covae]MCH4830679.1 helix-turn-helix transcriptional regulator [Flavobacterium columnare]MCH4833384.1 helix-turn-helix transcriptional regulator [Flavobacterium columnare]